MAEIECERAVDRVIEISNLSFNSMNITLSNSIEKWSRLQNTRQEDLNDLWKLSDDVGFDLLHLEEEKYWGH